MKIKSRKKLISKGDFPSSKKCLLIEKEIENAIKNIKYPSGADGFYLFDESGKKRGKGNGVKPIKSLFMKELENNSWSLETPVDIATVKRPGPLDATKKIDQKLFAVEWETGNISSSHRAINKMALGLIKNILIGGILILPTREMYKLLTDRIGNYKEIEPYFPLWESLNCNISEGLLQVIAIEHDGVRSNIPRIPKGTDGRAIS